MLRYSSVIYQAQVTSVKGNEWYVGLTANTFTQRYSQHKHTFRDPNKKVSTELSKYIWSLKEKNIDYSIK